MSDQGKEGASVRAPAGGPVVSDATMKAWVTEALVVFDADAIPQVERAIDELNQRKDLMEGFVRGWVYCRASVVGLCMMPQVDDGSTGGEPEISRVVVTVLGCWVKVRDGDARLFPSGGGSP